MKTIFFTEKVHNKRTKRSGIKKNKSRVEIILSTTKQRKEMKIMQKRKRNKNLAKKKKINSSRPNRISSISIFLMHINKKCVKMKTVKKETF